MRAKKLSTILFGIIAMMILAPSINASDFSSAQEDIEYVRDISKEDIKENPQAIVDQKLVEYNPEEIKKSLRPIESKAGVKYAPENATPEEVAAAEPTDIVIFKDARLESSVAYVLKVNPGEITVADMSKLNGFNYYSENIIDLTGFEYAVNLNSVLYILGEIKDLTPISNLVKVKDLFLSGCGITDVSYLSNLTNLAYLRLDENNISDITPLAHLTSLRSLTLSENNISDISQLSNLTNLKILEISENNITDISVIEKFSNLYYLDIAGLNLGDISEVENLREMIYLNAEGNNITDITPLRKLTKMHDLDLSQNNISDISALSKMVNLDGLNMGYNKISDITPLSRTYTLSGLYLNNNNISDMTPIKNLANMRYCNLGYNNITELPDLSRLKSLEILEMNNNKISDISPVQTIGNTNYIMSLNFADQEIELPNLTVKNDDEIIYILKGIEGVDIPVSLGVPAIGENNLSAAKTVQIPAEYERSTKFNASITQKVTYRELSGLETAEVNEGKALTSDQLISLFYVVSEKNQPITVNQSKVNYHKPGTYNVVFEDGIDKVTLSLVVTDVLPTMLLKNDTVTIKLGEKLTDYVSKFGIVATEITEGDLSAAVTVDESGVDFNKVGTHQVKFKINDEEGNTIEKTGNVVIEKNAGVISDTKKQNVTSDVTTENSIKAMTADDKELSSTGNKENIILVVLSILVIGLVGLKKTNVRKN